MDIFTIEEERQQGSELLDRIMECYELEDREEKDPDFTLALENLWETMSYIFKRVWQKVHNLGYRVFKASRNRFMDINEHADRTMSIWTNSLSKKIGKLDRDRLSEKEMELFPFSIWVESVKLAIELMNFCKHPDGHLNNTSKDINTAYSKGIYAKLQEMGIVVEPDKLTVNYDAWLDKRGFVSIDENGYDKSQLPNIMRYALSMGKVILSTAEQDTLYRKYDTFLTSAAQISEQKKKKFSKKDIRYEESQNAFGNQILRVGFCYCVLGVASKMLQVLSNDAVKLFDSIDDLIVMK